MAVGGGMLEDSSLVINSKTQYAVLNPLDDSRAGHSSIDEEKFKEIVWPKLVIAKLEDERKTDSIDEVNSS